MRLEHNPELHKLDHKEWPRYVVQHNSQPFSDGPMFLRYDRPNHCAAINPDGSVAWEQEGQAWDYDTSRELFQCVRRRVAPLYAYALLMRHNGIDP